MHPKYAVVKQTVHKILEYKGKPQRISLRLISTKSGLKSIMLQLDKLPLTKAFINSVIETPIDLHCRRIQWAVKKLEKDNINLNVYNIVEMVGVGNKYRRLVVEEVKEFLNNL